MPFPWLGTCGGDCSTRTAQGPGRRRCCRCCNGTALPSNPRCVLQTFLQMIADQTKELERQRRERETLRSVVDNGGGVPQGHATAGGGGPRCCCPPPAPAGPGTAAAPAPPATRVVELVSWTEGCRMAGRAVEFQKRQALEGVVGGAGVECCLVDMAPPPPPDQRRGSGVL